MAWEEATHSFNETRAQHCYAGTVRRVDKVEMLWVVRESAVHKRLCSVIIVPLSVLQTHPQGSLFVSEEMMA
jgi:hypothetical protein